VSQEVTCGDIHTFDSIIIGAFSTKVFDDDKLELVLAVLVVEILLDPFSFFEAADRAADEETGEEELVDDVRRDVAVCAGHEDFVTFFEGGHCGEGMEDRFRDRGETERVRGHAIFQGDTMFSLASNNRFAVDENDVIRFSCGVGEQDQKS
jgi:hypothetical protein